MSTYGEIPIHHSPGGKAIAFERILPAAEDVRNSVHRHDYSEIFVFGSGGGSHMIDLEHYTIASPCVHVVRGGQVHQLVRSGDMEGFVFEFKMDALQEPSRRADAASLFSAVQRRPSLSLDGGRITILSDLARMLEGEMADGGDGQEQVLAGYLGIVLAKCARWWAGTLPEESAADALNSDLIHRFRALVERHFLEMQQVKDYAERLHVTPGHLNDVVRKRLGSTAGALIDERLQLEAKRLLLHGELSVKETGYAIGMKDPAYFARWFKRMEGLSPVDFRNTAREKYR